MTCGRYSPTFLIKAQIESILQLCRVKFGEERVPFQNGNVTTTRETEVESANWDVPVFDFCSPHVVFARLVKLHVESVQSFCGHQSPIVKPGSGGDCHVVLRCDFGVVLLWENAAGSLLLYKCRQLCLSGLWYLSLSSHHNQVSLLPHYSVNLDFNS